MRTMNPYLFFYGRCEEALDHYTDALGARVKTKMRFGEAMPSTKAEHARLIVHAEVEGEGLFFMASDGMPGATPPAAGGRVSLSLRLGSLDEQDRVWGKLADGGVVQHPLHQTFYGDRMGALTDRFGVDWMVSAPLAPK
jgi:PhnB protein